MEAIKNCLFNPWVKSDKMSDKRKAGGVFLIITSIVMILLGALFASGMMTQHFNATPYQMYFAGAGLTIGAMVPLIVGAVLLSSKVPSRRTNLG